MSRTGSISLPAAALLLLLAGRAAAQEEGILMLDEVNIQGQVREPSVAIISSRLQPEISGFRLEKSFFDQLRTPDPRLVGLDRALVRGERLRDRESLLARTRILPQTAWPLKGSPASADQDKAATEDESGK
ncbi:MAG: hypothetical protein Q8O14_03005 [bacterium]|jgi:hypothetical protein|nr:hypothetical protein [bacterium]